MPLPEAILPGGGLGDGGRGQRVRVDAGQREVPEGEADTAYLELLPGPAIPHRHSRFLTQTQATVDVSATLLSAEILLPGRKYAGAGELFEYDLYSSAMTATRPDGARLFTEKLVAQPWRQPVRRAGVMAKFDVLANVTVVTPPHYADRIFEQAAPVSGPECMAGASRLPNDAGLSYKVIGTATAPVKSQVRTFWAQVRQEVAGAHIPPAKLWG